MAYPFACHFNPSWKKNNYLKPWNIGFRFVKTAAESGHIAFEHLLFFLPFQIFATISINTYHTPLSFHQFATTEHLSSPHFAFFSL